MVADPPEPRSPPGSGTAEQGCARLPPEPPYLSRARRERRVRVASPPPPPSPPPAAAPRRNRGPAPPPARGLGVSRTLTASPGPSGTAPAPHGQSQTPQAAGAGWQSVALSLSACGVQPSHFIPLNSRSPDEPPRPSFACSLAGFGVQGAALYTLQSQGDSL